MKKVMEICYWLLRPESSSEERSYKSLQQTAPWSLSNIIKVTFWYCLALILSLLLSNLQ